MTDVRVEARSSGAPVGALSHAEQKTSAPVIPEHPHGLEVAPDLEDFFENGSLALHLVGPDGTILRANKAELRLLGYQANEYVGRSIADFHADPPVIADILARLTRGENLEKYPARLKHKDGSTRHVEITSSVQFRDGQFINTRCFTVDVTDLVHARAQVRQNEAMLKQVLEALPAAVYTTDAAGKITYFNRAAVDLAGREPEIGKDEWCVTWRLHTTDGKPLPHDQCPMAVALKEDRPVRGVEALAERPDGTMVPFLPFPTPLHDENGTLTGALNMLVDISERKNSETQQRVLLSELNHRVKNNLQMLYSLLLGAWRKTGNAEARTVLADAGQRVAAMAAAQQLLYDARNPHSFQANEFMQAVSAAAKQSFEKEIEIEIEPAAGELPNDVATPLALILNELLTNAVKHGVNGRDRGTIKIGLPRDGNLCSLYVQDDGPGFDLEQAVKRSSGLSLVAGLARQLGGTFEVLPGRGAHCVVRFDGLRTAY